MKKAIEIIRRKEDSRNDTHNFRVIDQFTYVHTGEEEKNFPIIDCITEMMRHNPDAPKQKHIGGDLEDDDELHTTLNIFHLNKRRVAKVVVYFENR
jgi:hypothetical protein